MKKFIPVLMKTQIFSGVSEQDMESLLGCLQGRINTYKKGDYVFTQGDCVRDVAVLVDGCLHIQQDDFWGNRSILGQINAGEMFGESYLTYVSGPLPNDVVAVSDSTVIFFNANRIIITCPSACRFHELVVKNMFYAISEKNRKLVQKLSHMSRRSTREKLISYLSEQAKQQNSSYFVIPFNRQQLAEFLSVDRSAMSNELCKMRDEGLLEFKKNTFRLL